MIFLKVDFLMRRTCLPFALLLIGICVGWGTSQNPPVKDIKKDAKPIPKVVVEDTSKDDLKIVNEGGLKGEGADLLEFFRKRTFKQPDPKQLTSLVKQLGDDDFATREKAYTMLRDMGASAMSAIKQGETDADLEVRKRIGDLRQRIENRTEQLVQAAAAPAGQIQARRHGRRAHGLLALRHRYSRGG